MALYVFSILTATNTGESLDARYTLPLSNRDYNKLRNYVELIDLKDLVHRINHYCPKMQPPLDDFEVLRIFQILQKNCPIKNLNMEMLSFVHV